MTRSPNEKSKKKWGKATKVKSKPPRAADKGSTAASVRFVSLRAVMALHRESLAEHGGLDGLRDEGLLDSALARCVHRARYEPDSSMQQLAAALAFGIARNHPFNDGNKRAALVASFLCLELNGWKVVASQADAYETFYALAAGERTEEQVAEWFVANTKAKRGRS